MSRREAPLSFTVFLIFVFLLSVCINVFVFADVHRFNWLLHRPGAATAKILAGMEETDAVKLLRESILNVRVESCTEAGSWSTGTGFVVKEGFLATAAHVVAGNQSCNKPIFLVDYRGLQHSAQLIGFATDTDLAVLRFSERSLRPLQMADANAYKNVDAAVTVVTIGYPLLGDASAADKAAVSGAGHISAYKDDENIFVTSGMNLNPGNSGGPIFIRSNWTVLGIAVRKFDVNKGEGLGEFVPIDTFEDFFADKTGQSL
jgi:S1-C subfamily serine protease